MDDNAQKTDYCDGMECNTSYDNRCGSRQDCMVCTLLKGHRGNHVACFRSDNMNKLHYHNLRNWSKDE